MATHVILAVPFALIGGVLLQWSTGFNFSVAVWVGYIARRPRRRRHASPLIHILVATPVIFAWLREREFRKLAT